MVPRAIKVPVEVIAFRQQQVLGGRDCQMALLSIPHRYIVGDREEEQEDEEVAADS